MARPFRGRRESIIRDESFIFIGRTRGGGRERGGGEGAQAKGSFDSLCRSGALCPLQGLTRSINLVFLHKQPVLALSSLVDRFFIVYDIKTTHCEIYRLGRV